MAYYVGIVIEKAKARELIEALQRGERAVIAARATAAELAADTARPSWTRSGAVRSRAKGRRRASSLST